MRELTDHKCGVVNEHAIIEVLDEPGDGGAYHHYAICGFHTRTNPSADDSVGRDTTICHILFQNGPVPEVGCNGVTNEALLAILIDRMRGFQSGKFSCRENAIALTHLEDALHWLQHRTRQREARGVEGTHKP